MKHSTDFELLFESAPISLWLEDYSPLQALFQRWRQQGVTDLLAHLQAHPQLAEECARCYQVIRVNRETLRVFAASSQEELLSRLPEVFRGDMFSRMAYELNQLWNGNLNFSARSVNYALDGRRIEVLMHVRVLEGFEDSWERVMVSLQDVTAHEQSRMQLEFSEQHARNLFAFSPVSLWVEDFSGVKMLMDEVRASGIDDFRTFLNVHSEFVERCMQKIVVQEVNRQTLSMFSARTPEELLGKLDNVFRGEMHASFAEQLIDLWNGKLHQTREVVNYSLTGERNALTAEADTAKSKVSELEGMLKAAQDEALAAAGQRDGRDPFQSVVADQEVISLLQNSAHGSARLAYGRWFVGPPEARWEST